MTPSRPRRRVHAGVGKNLERGWTLCGLFNKDVEISGDWSRVDCGHCVKLVAAIRPQNGQGPGADAPGPEPWPMRDIRQDPHHRSRP